MSDIHEAEHFFTPEEVAERWRVSEKTVQRLIRAGKLSHVRIGRQVRLRPSDVQKYESKK